MSMLGILFSILMILLLIYESVLLIKSLNNKDKKKSLLHLLGVTSSLFVSIFTITSSLQIDFKSPNLAIVTFILATIFFIWSSIDSIKSGSKN